MDHSLDFNPIDRFSEPIITGIETVSFQNSTPIQGGLAVQLKEETLVLATGKSLFGVVQECHQIDKNLFLISVATRGSMVAVQISQDDKSTAPATVAFKDGLAVSQADGIYSILSRNDTMFFTTNGNVLSAVYIKL